MENQTKTALETYTEIVQSLIKLSKDNGECVTPTTVAHTAIEILKTQHSQDIANNW